MNYGHRNCTAILPVSTKRKLVNHPNVPIGYRERTHGCWCSAWKRDKNGQWWVWRRDGWCKPSRGSMVRLSAEAEERLGLTEPED